MFPVAAVLEEKQELQASLAASEARFRGLAHADELTGLPNRRAFNLELENAWSIALAGSRPLPSRSSTPTSSSSTTTSLAIWAEMTASAASPGSLPQ